MYVILYFMNCLESSFDSFKFGYIMNVYGKKNFVLFLIKAIFYLNVLLKLVQFVKQWLIYQQNNIIGSNK